MFQNLVHKTKRILIFMSVNEICKYGGFNEEQKGETVTNQDALQ